MPINDTEEIVSYLCQKTFLSLWAYPNPVRRDNGKELCDVLVIFPPYAFIFSVKSINIRGMDMDTNAKRWLKRGVHRSAKQIDGALRALNRNVSIYDNEMKPISYNNFDKIFRIAVCFGRGDTFPLEQGKITEHGFTHVLDEKSVYIILQELDTFSDIAKYLDEKEKASHKTICFAEEDLLASYICNNRSFPLNHEFVLIDEGIWEKLQNEQKYRNKKLEDKKYSLYWDKIIEEFASCYKANQLTENSDRKDTEMALRAIANENRFSRRILGKSFLEVMGKPEEIRGGNEPIRARKLQAPSGLVYVFLAFSIGRNDKQLREDRCDELYLRCIVARYLSPKCRIVVGIASDPLGSPRHSLELVYCDLKWTSELGEEARNIQNTYGYFKNANESKNSEMEFPE